VVIIVFIVVVCKQLSVGLAMKTYGGVDIRLWREADVSLSHRSHTAGDRAITVTKYVILIKHSCTSL
jgi:hypothetical protein